MKRDEETCLSTPLWLRWRGTGILDPGGSCRLHALERHLKPHDWWSKGMGLQPAARRFFRLPFGQTMAYLLRPWSPQNLRGGRTASGMARDGRQGERVGEGLARWTVPTSSKYSVRFLSNLDSLPAPNILRRSDPRQMWSQINMCSGKYIQLSSSSTDLCSAAIEIQAWPRSFRFALI
ncbi:hypothetical protein BO86DRAFT_131385 [Aspergillus japonicus CBS 114.51]|uniref:Uncharacterized protein n=1 Tax=Aspergillus japonicus CBS 114.51 TaxID=1448312 RepID=A0A8T8WWL1_ASPJA|nr:hypothetical protein BO86DRAFT_131385 [Aspergillus japonicus CBS 114.51]RAH80266.1 hypothetical protein BO86DRAFT_131385 [Aspergillus japonicus CBS 114.51]